VQWVLLALLFWYSLLSAGMPTRFGTPFFLFVLFIYSLRGLIAAAVTSASRG